MPISKSLVLALALVLTLGSAPAQTPAPTPAAATSATAAASPNPAESAAPSPTPHDYTADIIKAENDRAKIENDLKAEPPIATLCANAVAMSHDVETRAAEAAKTLGGKPSLNTVRELRTTWQQIQANAAALKGDLNKRNALYRTQSAALDKIKNGVEKDWNPLLKDGTPPTLPPKEWKDRLDKLAKSAAANKDEIQKRVSTLTAPLAALNEQDLKITATLDAIDDAEPKAVAQLFKSETDPVWRIPVWSASLRVAAGLDFGHEARKAWQKQCADLAAYVDTHTDTLLTHLASFIVLLCGLWWTRRRLSAWVEDEPSLKHAAVVFEVPTSMAIAFSLVGFPWVYPDAPRLLTAIAGAAALIPAILILRRLIDRHLFPILNLLVVLYFVDQLRSVASPFPIAARLLFLAELTAGGGFLAWMICTRRLEAQRQVDARLAQATSNLVKAALAALFAALLANSIGCVDLSYLVGNAALGSAYLAVVLYAASRVVDGVVIGALSIAPMANLKAVRQHRMLLWLRTHRFIKVAAVVSWVLGTLELLAARTRTLDLLKDALWNSRGEWTVLGQILFFGLVVWAAFLLSRFIRFVLEEDVYPRVSMERGLSYAISTVLHYAVLMAGFYIAASKVWGDMTKFTILVSAFGVGMGFGLQNIINNFVSGVILLFERPVKVGDVVQIDNATSGVVDRIGIRASVIRTGSGSEIILPNGKLISDQVINWTLSNRQRGLDLTVNVAYGSDPCRVMEVMKGIAAAHPLVAAKPAPNALLSDLKPDSLEFKLTAWTDRIEQCGQIRSDLAVAILAAFEKEGIQRPSPATPVPVAS